MVTLEPLDHELILLARGEARAHRFPRPAAADPTVLRLGDPDQTFLRHRVDRVVIHLVPKFKLPGHRMFAWQAVQLLHRHQPVPRKGLLRPIPEVRLIPGVHGNRPAVRPRLMPFHRLGRRYIWRMLGHRHMVRERRVVLRPDHQPCHFVIGVTGLPAPIRPVHRVAVHVDVVPVVDPPVFGRLRVDMDLMLAHPRRPLIHPIGIPEVGLIHLHPVVHRPLAMHPMPGLGRHTVELIALLPQRVGVPLDLLPRQFDVPHRLIVMVLRRDGNPVVIRPHIRVRRHDRVRQVRRRFRPFPVRDEVFPIFNGFWLDPVVLIPARPRPLRLRLVRLFPERMPRIRPTHHHPALLRLQHGIHAVAVAGGAGI